MGSKKMSLAEQFPHIQNLADTHGLYALMNEYLSWLRHRNYSEQTIAGRELFLCGLIDWCGQRNLVRPGEITKPILERYQRYLSLYRKVDGDALSFRSQYNRIVAVRTWFKWLARQDLILTNPASDLELPRLEKRLPKAILNDREAETILSVPDVHTDMGLRDRAILETLYSTGIRRMELVNLKLQDIDNERGTLVVRQGKGKKDRMIPIGSRAVKWIEKYTSDVRPEFICGRDEGVLFLSRYGDAISTNNLTTLVRGYVDQSKIGKKGACHLFRHSMATLMLENGADIRFIQVMLGHVSLNTTEMYTQVSIKKLKEVHSLTHPAQHGRTRFVDSDDVEPTQDALFSMLADEAQEDE